MPASSKPSRWPNDRILSNINFILSAKFLSDFAAFMNMVALSSYIYYLSESPIMVGVFLACRVIGGMLASLVSNRLFRLYPGKVSLVCLDLIRATCLSLLLITHMDNHLTIIPFIGFILGMSNSLFSIGLNSQLASFVGTQNLGNTNSWITTLSSIGMVLGALSSGIIIDVFSYESVILLNILGNLSAATCIALVIHLYPEEIKQGESQQSLKEDIRVLKQTLSKSPIISAMLLITLTDTLGSASHNVGFPIIAKYFDQNSAPQIMGYIIAIWALGKLSGALLSKYIRLIPKQQASEDDKRRMEKSFFIAIILMSSGFILAFNQDSLTPSLICFFIAGAGDGISEVCFITRAQNTENKIRLALFSSISFMQNTGFGVGMLISAFAFEYLAHGYVVGLFHGLPIIIVVILFFRMRQKPLSNTSSI
ncbi:MAG: MFS transporter [Marinomonas sp.]